MELSARAQSCSTTTSSVTRTVPMGLPLLFPAAARKQNKYWNLRASLGYEVPINLAPALALRAFALQLSFWGGGSRLQLCTFHRLWSPAALLHFPHRTCPAGWTLHPVLSQVPTPTFLCNTASFYGTSKIFWSYVEATCTYFSRALQPRVSTAWPPHNQNSNFRPLQWLEIYFLML